MRAIPRLRLLVLAATASLGWLIAGCSTSARGFRRITGADRCMAMPVYAAPGGKRYIGILIGGALVPADTGLVAAIDLSVVVDGLQRSVWRRESEVRQWYVPLRVISAAECHWTPPDLLPAGQPWRSSDLEVGIDVRLWQRRFGRGWSARRGLGTSGPPL